MRAWLEESWLVNFSIKASEASNTGSNLHSILSWLDKWASRAEASLFKTLKQNNILGICESGNAGGVAASKSPKIVMSPEKSILSIMLLQLIVTWADSALLVPPQLSSPLTAPAHYGQKWPLRRWISLTRDFSTCAAFWTTRKLTSYTEFHNDSDKPKQFCI